MRLTERAWAAVVEFVAWINPTVLNSFGELGGLQRPLVDSLEWSVGPTDLYPGAFTPPKPHIGDGNLGDPIFKPPTGDDKFQCDYRKMKGWQPCSSPSNRECWLRHPDGREYNVMTNYEVDSPIGVQRNYTLVINDGWIDADGRNFTEAKLFNNTYPGPWIQACWGDTVNVKVVNRMKHNGTSIHWHGIRQNQTSHMDGVNGVTQCPISPGDSYTYSFRAVQYGSSWYHSHYSVQYADGLLGPLTIHGPDTADFDEPKQPILMTDWVWEWVQYMLTKPPNDGIGHDSAFSSIYLQNPNLKNPSILLNGRGNVTRFDSKNPPPDSPIPEEFVLHFEKRHIGQNGKAKRYMLRLINTSFRSTFVFSIDNHALKVIDTDFVPIEPYYNTSIRVGIGQRYRVIVEARPEEDDDESNPIPEDGNFWIRTFVADECGQPGQLGYERTGIVRYNSNSKSDPTSRPWPNISLACSDEPYDSLRPKFPWFVGSAANGEERFTLKSNFTSGGQPFPLAKFALDPESATGFTPLQINYSQPMIQHLDDFSGKWPSQWVVIPEDFNSSSWIHLHGHDFAILQQSDQSYSLDRVNLTLNNPPRRDVVLLPKNGFIIIAFKSDNPGTWLMHCHIAFHASEGLALQILERQPDANRLFNSPSSPITKEVERVCDNWNQWYGDCKNWWSGCDGSHIFQCQDDSGI
ncbi:hypothetical protein VMCG_10276 [Cytospora schulzeri]|uniref:Uncharacterized protein n=1 Tax=Cytospora schulzeri TaxID=448051 RepID=A0A423VAH5_9PEZI|nr:hypothetical protein VMCG_10276 [Valsa malicola]